MYDPVSEAGSLVVQGYDPEVALRYTFSQSGAMVQFFLAMLIGLFAWVMAYGYSIYAMRLTRGQDAGFSDLFSVFHLAAKIIALQLLQMLFIFLWAMLFVIPGIVAAYRYSQAGYLLLDNPDLPVLECLRRSKEMMRGRKMDLFVLNLSFLGWYILFSIPANLLGALLPSGLGYDFLITVVSILCSVWITPYVQCTEVGFYDLIRGQSDAQEPPHDEWNSTWNNGDKTDPWN
jgi:uncharacterized membrane protein